MAGGVRLPPGRRLSSCMKREVALERLQLRRSRHPFERQRVAVAGLDHGGAGSKRGRARKGGEAREFGIGIETMSLLVRLVIVSAP